MPSKGLRGTSLSVGTILDAGDKVRKPLKPVLGIGDVSVSLFFFMRP